MKQRNKQLIALAILLLALVGGLVWLLQHPAPDVARAPSSSVQGEAESGRQLLDNQPTQMQVLLAQSEEEESYTVVFSEDGVPSIAEIPEPWLDVERVTQLTQRMKQMRLTPLAFDPTKDPSRLEDWVGYGLGPDEKTRQQVRITFADQNTQTIELGNATISGEQTYLRLAGEEQLYLIATEDANKITSPLFSYVTHQITPSLADLQREEMPTIERLSVIRAQQEGQPRQEYLMEQQNVPNETLKHASSLQLIKPQQATLSSTKLDEQILPTLFGLTATEVLTLEADAYLAEQGWGMPDVEVSFAYDDTTMTLHGFAMDPREPTSSPEAGTFYAVQEAGKPVLYAVAEADFPLFTVEIERLIPSVGVLPPIDTVSKLVLTLEDETDRFVLAGNQDPNDLSGMAVHREDQKLPVADFKAFYMLLMSPGLERLDDTLPKTEPVLELEYHYHQAKQTPPTVVTFYLEEGVLRYVLDGVPYATGSSSFVQKVRTQRANLLAGKPVHIDG